jgi:hypothetical protein
VYQLVLLGRLHHAPPVQPERAQDGQHVDVEVGLQLLYPVQYRDEAAGAANPGAAMHHDGRDFSRALARPPPLPPRRLHPRFDRRLGLVIVVEEVQRHLQQLLGVGHLVVLPVGEPVVPDGSRFVLVGVGHFQVANRAFIQDLLFEVPDLKRAVLHLAHLLELERLLFELVVAVGVEREFVAFARGLHVEKRLGSRLILLAQREVQLALAPPLLDQPSQHHDAHALIKSDNR